MVFERLLLVVYAWLFLGSVASAQLEIVFPLGLENVEGNVDFTAEDFNFSFSNGLRVQSLYSNDELIAALEGQPHLVTGFRWRPDRNMLVPPLAPEQRAEIRLSTTNASSESLSLRFADNIGSNEMVVHDAAIKFATFNQGPMDGPKDFDMTIEFETPFLYEPAQGNLLMDAVYYVGGQFLGADEHESPGYSWVASDSVDANIASFEGSTATVTQFLFEPVPLSDHFCDIEVPGQVFCDDFTDGNARDGEPVSWRPLGNTKASIEENDLIVEGNIPFDNLAIAQGVNLADVSIRARVRLVEESAMGVAVRDGGVRGNGGCNYFGWIDAESAVDAENAGLAMGCSPQEIGEAVPLDFDVSEQDTMMQLDVFGDSIRLWVWPADKNRPIEPLVSGTDSSLPNGEVVLWSADKDALDPNPTHSGKGIFRYVHVATEPITLGISFDCNGDGLTDVFDVNCATPDDLDETLETAGLLRGDLDGNRQVEFLDFLVLADNFGTPGDYTQGDVDKSGQVDFHDFLILSRNLGQESMVAAVPEPSALMLIVLGLAGTFRRLRRSSTPHENLGASA